MVHAGLGGAGAGHKAVMRHMSVNVNALRGTKRDLDSARDDILKALSDVHHPEDDFPFRDLMVRGVRALGDDAELAAKRCRRIRDGIQDALDDMEELDRHLHDAATRTARKYGGDAAPSERHQ